MKPRAYIILREQPADFEAGNPYRADFLFRFNGETFFSGTYEGDLDFERVAGDITQRLIDSCPNCKEVVVPGFENTTLDGLEEFLREQSIIKVTRGRTDGF